MDRIDAINLFIRKRGYRRLLVIGPLGEDRWGRIEIASKFTVAAETAEDMATAFGDGESFDIVVIDDGRRQTIFLLVNTALEHLSPGGAVMITGCMSGEAAKAFVMFRERPDLDAFVGDFDGGVGLIRKIPNPTRTVIGKAMDQILDEDIEANREMWLRPQPPFVLDMIAERLWSPPTIAMLVIGKSDEEIEWFKTNSPHVEIEARMVYVSNPGRRHGATAAIANPFIEAATEDVIAIVHADTTFDVGVVSAFALAADHNHAVTGIVGRIKSPHPLQETNMGYLWCTEGGGFVSTLDSCSVFFRRAWDLRFDGDTFDDFHCVVEDICLQARKKGIRSFVPALKASHLGITTEASRLGTSTETTWSDTFWKYRDKLLKKYPGEEIHTV